MIPILFITPSSRISVNWLIYIWAVQNERIFEASLGYYINPLFVVLLGVVVVVNVLGLHVAKRIVPRYGWRNCLAQI